MLTLAPLQRRHRRSEATLRVLTYHRVANRSHSQSELFDPRLISTPPALFTQQMEHLARARSVVPLETVLRGVTDGAALPRKATLITFDDASLDLAHHALPTLSRLGLPAVVFVPTAYPDHPERGFWWDRVHRALLHSRRSEVRVEDLPALPLGPSAARPELIRRVHDHLKRLPPARLSAAVEEICDEHGDGPLIAQTVLSWDELRTWTTRGVAVASHSRTHPILTKLPIAEAAREIAESQADIDRCIGVSYPVFCFPNGGVDAILVALLRDMGFAMAFTTQAGGNNLARCEPLLLKRQSVYRRSVLPVFRFRLTRLGGAVDAWRGRRPDADTGEPVELRQGKCDVPRA